MPKFHSLSTIQIYDKGVEPCNTLGACYTIDIYIDFSHNEQSISLASAFSGPTKLPNFIDVLMLETQICVLCGPESVAPIRDLGPDY